MALSLGQIHGMLMIVGFGLILPLGALSTRCLKHRPKSLWFRIHVICQLLGLAVGLGGFAIAVANFQTFDILASTTDDPHHRAKEIAYIHACCGLVVVALALLQPTMAICKPPRSAKQVVTPSRSTSLDNRRGSNRDVEDGEGKNKTKNGSTADRATASTKKTMGRRVWEILHTTVGYIVLFLGAATLVLGTTLVDYSLVFQLAYMVGVWGFLAVLAMFCAYDRFNWNLG